MNPFNNSTLVIVDDDPAMLRLVRMLAERVVAGRFDVECFDDSETAMKRIGDSGADILITDLEMPNSSGLDLLRCAKGRNAWTQVLMMTGHSTQTALLEAMELGASDYLVKPLDHAEFTEILQQTIHRQQRWRASLAATWKAQRKLQTTSAESDD